MSHRAPAPRRKIADIFVWRVGDRLSLRRMARAWPRAVLGVWIALCAWVGLVLQDIEDHVSGDLDGLLSEEHRRASDEQLVMLWLTGEPSAEDATTTDTLLAAAEIVRERLGTAWTPMAPPAAEVEAWLDAHALYLLPVEAHAALRERLTDAALTAAAASLRARLSSPLFGMSGEETRRDPLDLRGLASPLAGRFGHVRAGSPAGAQVSAAGDLLAADGRSMLLAVRTDTPPAVLTADLRTALSDRTVEIGVVGTARVRAEAAALVQRHGPRLALVALAGITVVLAAAFRRVRPAVAILIALGAAVGLMTAILPAIDPVSLPLLILLCGFGCEGSLHLHRISQRGWPSAIMLGSALVPLAFLRYPQWQAWSGWWVLAVLVMVVALRVVAPAFLVLMHSKPPSDRGFRLHPAPRLAVVASAIVLAAGVWAVENLPYQGVDRIDLGEALRPPEQIRLLEQFYDPALVVEVWTPASTDAQALERGAEEARLLTRLVPSAATRIDSPGSMILQPSELERRRRALEDLGLAERLTQLRATLEARGLRPGAFGEFLRGGPNQADLPTADAALTSPLGPWIRGYLIDHPEGRALRTRIYLTPDPDAPLPVVTDADDQPVVLRGPAAAARLDRDRFRNQLGICVAMQLWLGALVVWLATRSLAIALGAALAALVTQMGVLTSMVLLALPLGPLMLPTLLLVGAAAMIAAGRACRAARLQRPFSSAGLWVTSLCPAVAGLALVSSGVPQWEQWGLVTAIGAVLAAGVGLFIAPGLTAVLQSLGGGLGAPTPGEEEASS